MKLFAPAHRSRVTGLVAFALLGSFSHAEYLVREDMIDYDQRRAGLAADGSMHCYPTSMVDLFRYMDNHGFSNMNGPYGTSYNDVTDWINYLGTLMLTNPATGTNASNCYAVSTTWLYNHTGQPVLTSQYGSSWDWGVNTLRAWVRQGALIRVGFGRYKRTPLQTWDRYGGHSVAMSGWIDGGGQYFVVADPSNDSSINTQAPYELAAKETANITLNTTHAGNVTHARYTLGTGSNNDKRYMIDNIEVYMPMIAGWPVTTASNGIGINIPTQMDEATHAFPTYFQFNTIDTIVDWCFDPRTAGIVYLAGDGKIYQADYTDGTQLQIASIPGAKKIVVGGTKQDLYVLVPGLITDQVRYVNRQGGFGVVKDLGEHAAGFDYDEFRGGLTVCKKNHAGFITFDKSLGHRVDESSIQLMDGIRVSSVSETYFKVDHKTGDYIVANDGDHYWTRFVSRPGNRRLGGRVTYQADKGIEAIAPSENGLMFVQDNHTLMTLAADGSVYPTDFSGMSISTGKFHIPRSVVAVEPHEFEDPRFYNIPPGVDEP